MARERPILIVRRRQTATRKAGAADRRARSYFSPAQQSERLGEHFDRIQQSLASLAETGRTSTDINDIGPDRALVLELNAPVKDFAKEARRIGLGWLAEEQYDDDDEEEEDGQGGPDDDEETAPRKLYVSMPSVEALEKLLQLWSDFQAGQPPEYGYGAWWKIFGQMEQVRPWGPTDRVDPLTEKYLRDALAEASTRTVTLEIDLWFSTDQDIREAREQELRGLVRQAGGTVRDAVAIEDIAYHAALVELPGNRVEAIVARTAALARAHSIMSIRPQSVAARPIDPDRRPMARDDEEDASDPDVRPPIAALLDGFPMENHRLLAERIDVYPLDVTEEMAPLAGRYHGTQMASLIIHGDLDAGEEALDRRLIVLPVLAYDPDLGGERTPGHLLPIGVIHRAINALKDDADGEAIGPEVVVINHSLGDENAPFRGRPSHWARLLDHLAFAHRLLIIVSAGNVEHGFEVDGFPDIRSFRGHNAEERRDILLSAVERSKAARTMLAPAEAFNVLTVGAVHHDESDEAFPAGATDPFGSFRMSNLCSRLGPGIAGAIKPDLLMPGGRQPARPYAGPPFSVHGHSVEQLGQLAACPDRVGGRTNLTIRGTGTSNAAALATREALKIADALEDSELGEDWQDLPQRAVILKALLAHGCDWGEVGEHLDGLFPTPERWYARRSGISRFIGYGEPNTEKVMSGDRRRVTMLAYGSIKNEKRDEYEIPLPPSLASQTHFRRLTATLAWASPVRPYARNYRAVGLELTDANGGTAIWSGTDRLQHQPPHKTTVKGTLIHFVAEGQRAIPFVPGVGVTLGVQCRAATSAYNQIMVPYALAVTLEVADTIRSDIYAEVRQELVRQRAGTTRVRTT